MTDRWISTGTLIFSWPFFFQQTFSIEKKVETGAQTEFTLNRNTSTHILNNWLADTQSKTPTLRVCTAVLIQIAKVHEDLSDFVLGDAAPLVYNLNLES